MVSFFLAGAISSSPPAVEDTPSMAHVAVEECCFLPVAIEVASFLAPVNKKMVSSILAGAVGSSPPAVEVTPSLPPAAVNKCCFLPAAIGLNTTVPTFHNLVPTDAIQKNL